MRAKPLPVLARLLVALAIAASVFGFAAIALADDPPTPLPTTPTAGRTVLVDKQSAPEASIFSVAYTLDDAPHAPRPVAFLWNGGPGSSSLWLHMGAFEPAPPMSSTACSATASASMVRADIDAFIASALAT